MSAQALDESKNNYIMCIVCTADQLRHFHRGHQYRRLSGDGGGKPAEASGRDHEVYADGDHLQRVPSLVSGVDMEDLKQRFGISIYGLEDWYFDDELCKRTLEGAFSGDRFAGRPWA